MQLPVWGEFKSSSEQWNYQVVTLNDEDNNICGCAMIQMRKVPLLKKDDVVYSTWLCCRFQ